MMSSFRKIVSLLGMASISILTLPSPGLTEYEHGAIRQGGCYNIGDEQIKFVASIVDTNNDNSLKRIASSVPTRCDDTHVWDDKWYYWTLPDNRNKYLLLTWKNITTGEYGYAFIHNTPQNWWYKTNESGYATIANNQQKKLTWSSNGHRIDIDIKNPENRNGWTANDIWYSFGY